MASQSIGARRSTSTNPYRAPAPASERCTRTRSPTASDGVAFSGPRSSVARRPRSAPSLNRTTIVRHRCATGPGQRTVRTAVVFAAKVRPPNASCGPPFDAPGHNTTRPTTVTRASAPATPASSRPDPVDNSAARLALPSVCRARSLRRCARAARRAARRPLGRIMTLVAFLEVDRLKCRELAPPVVDSHRARTFGVLSPTPSRIRNCKATPPHARNAHVSRSEWLAPAYACPRRPPRAAGGAPAATLA
jgi:hypothetical protein